MQKQVDDIRLIAPVIGCVLDWVGLMRTI